MSTASRLAGEDRPAPGAVTETLAEVRRGAPGAREALFRLVYGELRRLAGAHMRRQAPEHTLQATALVHEAYLRLVGSEAGWKDRSHFLAAAARAMRSILVDHARARSALKRGGSARRVGLDAAELGRRDAAEEIVAVHEALDRLEALRPEEARLVELRFFAGLEAEEAARVLGLSTRTAFRLWDHARAWLYREIGG